MAPNPYPSADEVSTNLGTRTKQPNSAKPAISVVMFVRSTVRCESISRSTIGARERRSTMPQQANRAAARPSAPIRRPDVQPHDSPSVSPSRSVTSAAESSTAPGISSGAFVRTGDSGT